MADSGQKDARQKKSRAHRSSEPTTRRRASEAGFRSIFEHVAIPLITYDKDGKIDRWNKAFESLFHLLKKDLQKKPFYKVLPGLDEKIRVDDLVRAVFQGKTNTDIQWRVNPENGPARDLAVSTFPVVDVTGKVAFGMAMFSDATERKSLERALFHSEKMAAMGTLASGLAHELGTPMNVILGRAESLLQTTQEDKTAKGLTTIIEQIDRMTQLINRLLAFARKTPIARRQIDVNILIQKSIELMGPQIRDRKVDVKTALDPKLPAIWGDSDQIVQIMVNLLMNALDALPPGGEISIKTSLLPARQALLSEWQSHTKQDRMIQIVFKDEGCGIDAEHLDRIFDPFFTTKPVGKGTGLGLAVVSGIVREHGGHITVCSLRDQGTTFSITLPRGR